MDQRKRFFVALAAYAVLAVLIWLTMDSNAVSIRTESGTLIRISFRSVTLGIVGLFAGLTVLRWKVREQHEAEAEERFRE